MSVIGQGYPRLQYIVMDGGSTDGTVDLLAKYSDRLAWFSEPDHGQGQAINKGLALATGDVLSFLNADDLYLPGALHKVGTFFAAHHEAHWLTGRCRVFDEHDREIRQLVTLYKNVLLLINGPRALSVVDYVSQPATFWTRRVLREVGLFDESLHYSLDYDYWLRIRPRFKLHVLPSYLAAFRMYRSSKSGASAANSLNGLLATAQRYEPSRLAIALHRIHRTLALAAYARLQAREARSAAAR